MRHLKWIVCAGLLTAQFAWAALPTFEGKLARIRMLEAKVLDAAGTDGAKGGLRIVYLVSRQEGVTGALALREPRDVLLNGRSYREVTRAELARDFEPRTTVGDAGAFLRDKPTLLPGGGAPDGSLVLTVELFGAAVPPASELRSRLQLGFDRKTENSEFTFTPVSD